MRSIALISLALALAASSMPLAARNTAGEISALKGQIGSAVGGVHHSAAHGLGSRTTGINEIGTGAESAAGAVNHVIDTATEHAKGASDVLGGKLSPGAAGTIVDAGNGATSVTGNLASRNTATGNLSGAGALAGEVGQAAGGIEGTGHGAPGADGQIAGNANGVSGAGRLTSRAVPGSVPAEGTVISDVGKVSGEALEAANQLPGRPFSSTTVPAKVDNIPVGGTA